MATVHRTAHRSPSRRASAGGVVVHPDGQHVLLRKPAQNPGFDDLQWTFAKGGLDGESPPVAAVREVLEELGVEAVIVAEIPGWFEGHRTTNKYFVMRWVGDVRAPDWETEAVCWATWDEAPALMRQGSNVSAIGRDLEVLREARTLWADLCGR